MPRKHSRKGSNTMVVLVTGVLVAVAVLVVSCGAMRLRSFVTHASSGGEMTRAVAAAGLQPAKVKPAPASPGTSALLPTTPVSAPATDQAVPVLMYHHVSPTAKNFIAISPELFDEQMRYLKDNGWHPVTMTQFGEFVLTGKRLPPKAVLITFDDGRMNQYKYAVPILKKYGFTATFFIVGKWMTSPSDSMMHVKELRTLSAEGFDVESHTRSHNMLYAKGDRDYAAMKRRLWDQTAGYRLWLDKQIGKPVIALALPGGGHDKWTPGLVKESGYQLAFTTEQGFAKYKTDALLIPRYNAGARGLTMRSYRAIFTKAEKEMAALKKPKTAADSTKTP